MIKLIGVLIVLIGFVFKIETLFVVVVAGISTGLVAGLSIQEILTILGQSFVDNRMVSLFVLTLPVIGVLERNGLRQRAVDLIGRIQSLTTGRIALVYVFTHCGSFGHRLNEWSNKLWMPTNTNRHCACNKTNKNINKGNTTCCK